MMKTGAALGGEQSGHIIFVTAKPPPATACSPRCASWNHGSHRTLSRRIIRRSQSLSAAHSEHSRPRKSPVRQIPAIAEAIAAAQREFDGNGRVVVRYSGTEALARVMIEAESEEKMNALTDSIAGAIKTALGV